MAKPLPKQTIDKGRVWTAFIGGAVTVFGLTVLSENNESWFPAIFRANKAMAISRKRAQVGRGGLTAGAQALRTGADHYTHNCHLHHCRLLYALASQLCLRAALRWVEGTQLDGRHALELQL